MNVKEEEKKEKEGAAEKRWFVGEKREIGDTEIEKIGCVCVNGYRQEVRREIRKGRVRREEKKKGLAERESACTSQGAMRG